MKDLPNGLASSNVSKIAKRLRKNLGLKTGSKDQLKNENQDSQ